MSAQSAQAQQTRTVQLWLIVLGVFFALPIPLSVVIGHTALRQPLRVTCSAAHPCPFVIHEAGQPLHALQLREVISFTPQR